MKNWRTDSFFDIKLFVFIIIVVITNLKQMILPRFLAVFILLLFVAGLDGTKPKLVDFVGHLYSQSGEEGVLIEIFDMIGTSASKLAIEFGAWDGFHLSNTALFFSKLSWSAVLIEADSERYATLVKNVAHLPLVKPIKSMVDIGENSLENILKSHGGLPTEVDLLSIDIDGNDYFVFESLESLRPRVIVCEYNPTFPAEVDMFGAYGPDNSMGSSIAALNRVAVQKGYLLVCITPNNGIWVRNEFAPLFVDKFNLVINDMQIRDYQVMLVTDMRGQVAFVKRGRSELGAMPYGFETVPYPGKLQGDISQLDISNLRFEILGVRPDPSAPFMGTNGGLTSLDTDAPAPAEQAAGHTAGTGGGPGGVSVDINELQ